MGNDAKIGLLFSLGIIIAIAFILYGVNEQAVNKNVDLFNRDDAAMSSSNKKPGNSYSPPRSTYSNNNSNDDNIENVTGNTGNSDYVRDLPGASESDQNAESLDNRINRLLPANDQQADIAGVPAGWPKTHTVADGENLTEISIKYYGSKEGNRWVNVTRIHKANLSVIPSMDDLKPGQKLIIPAIDGVLSSNNSSAARAVSPVAVNKTYTVVDGDRLYTIAKRLLGNGNRYHEIIKLNSAKIRNADEIIPGMVLVIPAK
ncbi:MAG: LysM peptidoglycan-binding domain-containing protein [Phycisphaerae bacterium]|nr:LysM peptidoglycan-binding domain-containing protein [Phycisphaerae bacterium]